MNSAIVWRGTSRIDRRTPVVVVLSGLATSSRNSKTGDMVQSWILVDGLSPKEAVYTGRDIAICGDCPMRRQRDGSRDCYVSLGTGLSAVGRKLSSYPKISIDVAAERIRGRDLRIGTYGDPAAVPFTVWNGLVKAAAGWTGYTHQWRKFPGLQSVCMASVDSEDEYLEAKEAGWRTFRVRHVGLEVEPLLPGEVVCPACAEAGHRATCQECQLCRGTARDAKDVAIIDHNTAARAAIVRRSRVALPMWAQP